jgi:hypothetical protein
MPWMELASEYCVAVVANALLFSDIFVDLADAVADAVGSCTLTAALLPMSDCFVNRLRQNHFLGEFTTVFSALDVAHNAIICEAKEGLQSKCTPTFVKQLVPTRKTKLTIELVN